MSLERAMVNCKRCYELATPSDPKANDKNSELYKARNQTMTALESTLCHNEYRTIAENALKVCLECKFYEPSVFYFIDKHINK